MGDKNNFKKNFVNIFCQITKMCKETGQETDINFNKGRKDAFDDVLQWYNKVSENGEKLVTVNQIILYLQEKIDKTKNELNINNNEQNNSMTNLFSFPVFD